jgi:hypothetical protein
VADDLDLIDPPPREVVFRGRPVQIRPLTIGQLPAFARALQPAADAMAAALADPGPAALLGLVARHGDDVIAAMSAASGLELAEVQGAGIPDSLRLLRAVMDVNRDFLPGRLTTLMQAAAAAMPGAGSTPPRP